MDNDFEITRAGDQDKMNKVQLFLHDSLKAIRQESQTPYSLNVEFAKTRKNRDFFVPGIIFAVVVLVLAGALVVTTRINRASRNVSVDIAVFEDLNLKNVLDMAKKAEDRLESVGQKRMTVQSDFQSNLSSLKLQRRSELDVLAAQRMTDAERTRRTGEITRRYSVLENKLDAGYRNDLAALDRELEDAKKQVESFDKKRVEEANQQKQVLDNQRDLFELERKKMQTSYEAEISDLRLRMDEVQNENARLKTAQIKELVDGFQSRIAQIDPVLGDEKSAALIESAAAGPDVGVPFQAGQPSIPEGVDFTAAAFSEMARGYSGIDFLLSKVASIPFDHEAGAFAGTARRMALLAGDASERLVRSAFTRIDETDRKLATETKIRSETETRLAEVSSDLEKTALERDTSAQQLAETGKALAETSAALETSRAAASSYEQAMTGAAAANGFAGFILNAADPEKPGLWFVPGTIDAVLAQENPVLYVYRGTKNIGLLSLSRNENGELAVTILKADKKRPFQPMDGLSAGKK
jgi:hypothetical protein